MSPAVQAHRLAKAGRVDRQRELHFTFDRCVLHGYAGDTLASALLANGVRVVGRSFKYHRSRGILTAGPEEPNALVELRDGAAREPNTKATTVELFDGLHATSQNRWPSLDFDLRAIYGSLSPVLVAGFYYKTFKWPGWAWERIYEPFIRRSAGLGRCSEESDPDAYEKAHAFCDVLVVGAGPAGLMAARAAAQAGARVMLCEQDFAGGGRLLSERARIGDLDAASWAERMLAELAELPNVRIMSRTCVFGAYDGGTYGALEQVSDHLPFVPQGRPRQRLWRIVARQSVLATGAVEQPIAFPNNDRPGIMLAGAVRSYVNRFGVSPGRRVAIFTNNDDAWRTAVDLMAHGVDVPVIVDTRDQVSPALRTAVQGTRVIHGGIVANTQGRSGLRGMEVRSGEGTEHIGVDALAVSSGWTPLPFQRGTNLAGAAAGTLTLRACLEDGSRRGADAARACGLRAPAPDVPPACDEPGARSEYCRVAVPGTAFVDFQHDVTAADIVLAHREGYRDREHLKRYTTLGMGTDQGRTANYTGLAMLAELEGRPLCEAGTASARPPAAPIAIGALAGMHRGRESRPARRTPSHDWAEARQAVFIEAGLWMRAQYFPEPGEGDWLDAVTREVRTVRSSAGFCDVSTLGKIELFGADVGIFLDRIYVNTFSTLPVGKIRYGIMLREDGFVLDDGTTSRLAAGHYYMTTTTAHAAAVMQHLEFCHQVHWPELDVRMVPATDQWAQLAIAGPHSRQLLARILDPRHDLSNDALPFMSTRPVTVCGGLDARLFRISFSGELAYELAVPASSATALADRLLAEGGDFGVTPYGTEALGVMRIEKGFVAGGEINGQTTATDLGFGALMSAKKDYVGRVMALRPALMATDRPALAGFRPVRPGSRLHAGAHLVALDAPIDAAHDEGHVTSVAFSPACGTWIGLGLISGGRERVGERVLACDPLRGNHVEVEICPPVFLDPQGGRMRA